MEAYIVISGNPKDGFEYAGPFPYYARATAYAERKVTSEWWIAELYQGQGAGAVVPKDSLWQAMTRNHLDPDRELTDDEWRQFVRDWQDEFARRSSEMAQEMMATWQASRPTPA